MAERDGGAITFDFEHYNLTEEDVDKMISDAAFFLLVADQKKSVIKRLDLMKTCEINKKHRQVQEYVLNRAAHILLDTFGIRVGEMDEKKGHYILTNALAEAERNHPFLDFSEKEVGQMGLIFTVLGLIFMNNGKVSEDVLFKFLAGLGLENSPDLVDLYDEDLKKYVNDVLVSKQHYLRRSKVQGAEADKEYYEYEWGDRAEAEVKKSDVLKMVCQVYDVEPRMFKEQYDLVKNAEELTDEDFLPPPPPAGAAAPVQQIDID